LIDEYSNMYVRCHYPYQANLILPKAMFGSLEGIGKHFS
jgi:hypothetical protein